MALCEVVLSDGSDLVAKELAFGQGYKTQHGSKFSSIFPEPSIP